ncbi:MAG: FkbM family methyltransferase [Aphanocapsa sp. GSE-SYN-MK-11-07L]|jgi:FkbM family methyltransferase|nr:FkbM family methyltransferase [Aphanocapsa sp. GSE-SYN-MK-11-07L]
MKRFVKAAAKSLGFEIHRISPNATNVTDPYAVMRRLIDNPQPIIFDVGANVGRTAKRFRSLFPEANIFCFEPFPSSFERLSSAFTNDPAIECHQLALADVPGISRLTVNQSSATNSLLTSDARAANYWGPNLLDTQAEIEVKTETVDRFCERKGLKHLDILKLDVQGAEFSVLEGARELLQNQCIDLIYMEMITAPTYVGQRKLHEYLGLFDTWKYEVFDFYNLCRKDARLIQTDNIMISSRFLSRYEQSGAANAT